MADPEIETRRPREGRCERCDRPLTDEAWTTWTPLLPADAAPVTDWREDDSTDTHCVGDPLCNREEIDWRARALAAEAEVADLRSALTTIECRLREDAAPLVALVNAHGDRKHREAWKAVYSSAVHAQAFIAAALAAAAGDDHA